VTLARSRSIDRLRARGSQERRREGLARQVEVEHDAQSRSSDPSRDAFDAERRERVLSALAQLPGEQRRALEIAYFEGLSHSEIAARLETPLGTVKTRIRQGMIRLRELLQQP
jgi:RNA polymerase sigma-70 factor (ECF subfamily)